MTRWLDAARRFLRGIWFRATAFAVGGIVLAIAAHLLSAALPDDLAIELGQESVSTILQIIATSMLAVTTFSLTAMVSAYASATQSGTPRSTQLLIADRTSQNALATFVGAFAYSIVGIIALSLQVLSDSGRTLLFLGTLLVIAIVLWTLLRWIAFLTRFGRMSDVIDRVERAAGDAARAYARDPRLGAAAWVEPPAAAAPIGADETGFVVHVDVWALQRLAERGDCRIWVNRRAGSRVTDDTPLAFVGGEVSAALRGDIQRAFVVAGHRSFDQDPRIGLIALSEVASRALSPGINDPGTAIEVLVATHRVLSAVMAAETDAAVTRPRVHLPLLDPQDLVVDAFRPIARDGAGLVEVAMRVQRELGALIAAAHGAWAGALRRQAVEAHERAMAALELETDRREVTRLHEAAMSAASER